MFRKVGHFVSQTPREISFSLKFRNWYIYFIDRILLIAHLWLVFQKVFNRWLPECSELLHFVCNHTELFGHILQIKQNNSAFSFLHSMPFSISISIRINMMQHEFLFVKTVCTWLATVISKWKQITLLQLITSTKNKRKVSLLFSSWWLDISLETL